MSACVYVRACVAKVVYIRDDIAYVASTGDCRLVGDALEIHMHVLLTVCRLLAASPSQVALQSDGGWRRVTRDHRPTDADEARARCRACAAVCQRARANAGGGGQGARRPHSARPRRRDARLHARPRRSVRAALCLHVRRECLDVRRR